MKKHVFSILLIISQVCYVLSLESTAPAFMWSPHIDQDLDEIVNYQTLSTKKKKLARAVMFKGSWSNIMCESKTSAQPVDVAVVFVGKEDEKQVQHQISVLLFVGLSCGVEMPLFTKLFGAVALTGKLSIWWPLSYLVIAVD